MKTKPVRDNKPHDDPSWPRASAWLAGKLAHEDYKGVGCNTGQMTVLGAPLRLGSITPGRTDLAPQAIRRILERFSTYDLEAEQDLANLKVTDLGDLDLASSNPEEAFEPLKSAVHDALRNSDALILLGGDNSITRPGVHGISSSLSASSLDTCGLLTLDAHHDLRDLSSGLSNGNPIRALLEDGMPGENIIQIGIQSFANSRKYWEVARDAGIKVITIEEVRARSLEAIVSDSLEQLSEHTHHIYVDLDIDVLDRIYAPATPGSRPGGLTPFEIRGAAKLCGKHPKVRVMDLVEIDPVNDVADVTIMAAAACLLSFASGLLSGMGILPMDHGLPMNHGRDA
ncbi:MAG: agmatinase family protein, partial [Pyrinomonadaceae bacterium]